MRQKSTKAEQACSEADAVRAAVSSPSLCSNAIVATLRQLLNIRDVTQEPLKVVNPDLPTTARRIATKTAAKTPAKTTARTTAKTTTQPTKPSKPPTRKANNKIAPADSVPVFTDAACSSSATPLSAQERQQLATTVVNTTLKVLTETPKTHSVLPDRVPDSKRDRGADTRKDQANCPKKDVSATSAKRTRVVPSVRDSPSPRFENVPPPLSELPNHSAPIRKTSPSISRLPAPSPLAPIAECCRLAFAYLRNASATPTPPLQLMKGMSVLIGKLIVHGLESLALKELRVLKRCLEQTSADPTSSDVVQDKETYATLLAVRLPLPSKEPAALLAQHQGHVLRLLAASGRSSAIESIVDMLDPCNPSSPSAIILKVHELGEQPDKVVKQLESLVRTLLSMCPSPSSVSDTEAMDLERHPAPEVVLKIQTFALLVQRLWWPLAAHNADEEKELYEPLSRFLDAFKRRCHLSPEDKYHSARSFVTRLLPLESYFSVVPSWSPGLFSILNLLSLLAQTSEHTTEALEYAHAMSKTAAWSSDAHALGLTCSMRIVALHIQDKDIPLAESLQFLKHLKTDLNISFGSNYAPHSLLIEIISTRVAAVKVLTTKYATSEPSSAVEELLFLAECVFLCARLQAALVKRIAKGVSRPKEKESSGQSHLALKTAGQCVNSCLVACKLLLRSRTDATDLIPPALQDCCELASASDSFETEIPFVHISNVYWSLYLRMSTSGEGSSQNHLALLRSSIDILQDRSLAEKEAGLLVTKLERLGALSLSSAEHVDAWTTFSQAIRTCLTPAFLEMLQELAGSRPLRAIVWAEIGFQPLLRNLLSLQKSALQQDRDVCFYDDTELSSSERAALLEVQIYLLEQPVQDRALQKRIELQLGLLYNVILEIYSTSKYPIRRAYCYTCLLRSSRDMYIIHQAVTQQALDYSLSSSELDEDQGLSMLLPYYQASLKMAQTLHGDNPSLPEIMASFSLFRDVVQAAQTWHDLMDMIDDINTFVAQLRTMEAFVALSGSDSVCLEILHLLAQIHTMEQPQDVDTSISTACQLATTHLRLGYSGRASVVVNQAEELCRKGGASVVNKIQLQLVKSQVAISMRDLVTANAATSTVDALLQVLKSGSDVDKMTVQQLRADRAFVCSMQQLHSGNIYAALAQGKRSAMISQTILKHLGRRSPSNTSERLSSPSGLDALAQDVQGLSLSDKNAAPDLQASETGITYGPDAWTLVPAILRNMVHMYTLYSHSGRRTEAEYYLNQAKKIASSINSSALKIQVHYLDAQHACALAVSTPTLDLAYLKNLENMEDSLQLAMLHLALGDLHARRQSWEKALESFEMTNLITTRLLTCTPIVATPLPFDVSLEQGKASRVKQQQPTPVKRTTTRKPAVSAKKPKASQIEASDRRPQNLVRSSESIPINDVRVAAMIKKAMTLMCQGSQSDAAECFERARLMATGCHESIMQKIAAARLLMSKSSEEAAADFTFNVLLESTLSFPALSSVARRKSHNEGPRSSLMSPPSQRSQHASSPKKGSRKRPTSSSFTVSLLEAQGNILTLQSEGVRTVSLPVCYQICELALQSTVLLSAIDTELPLPKLHPTRAAFSMELPRIESVRRDLSNTTIDAMHMINGEDITSPKYATLSAAQFQQDYIDIIPQSCVAISLSMSEDCSELYIVRYEAHHAPFIVRLPMVKHKFQDLEEDPMDEFDFEAGKTELSEIINLSNYSCHNSPDPSVKGSSLAWWAEREALDRRMQELLANIQSIWLGGFRGILSQHRRNTSLLARFRKSFELILDRHLSSRQGTKTLTKRLTLDSNVLQLFIGLGDDKEGSIDIDEALLDLLYFVIDVLQFNGERNAYDEVDFDSMATETLDALRSYHEAAGNEIYSEDRHLILVLDKRLHAFPWESMPCLETTSVSRVSSMLTLRERILAMRRQQGAGEDGDDRFIVPKSSGTYILNPGSDLKATQATLGPLLASVSDATDSRWKAIANRVPTEAEFSDALSDSSMLLYFGHGNGSQYIRNRAIKKLEKCSEVVWLMGCSSGSVTENGDFEPTSVPLSYMTAGRVHEQEGEVKEDGERDGLCMAVLATLWDVTDKDIDRFSVRVGEEWGLWTSVEETAQTMPKTPRKRGRSAPKTPSKTPSRTPGRSKSRTISSPSNAIKEKSLVQAVVKGREACHLKYLNGAATVVYGVPVYLGD